MDTVSIDNLSTSNSQSFKIKPIASEFSKDHTSNGTVNAVEINEDDGDDLILRFSSSDEEEEGSTDKCHTNFQPNQSDHKLDAQTSKAEEQEELTDNQDSSDKENSVLIKGSLNYKTTNSEAHSADGSWGVDERESAMSGSDRLGMYNSPKHWNFNKGWKGMNSSRGYPHRKGADWYKQHYSDKDKYSKTHYHNQSKFRLQNTPRSMFQSGPPLENDRRSKRDSLKLAQKLKSSLPSAEGSGSSSGSSGSGVSDKKQLVKENGLPNGLRSESSVQKNKSIEDAKNNLNSIKIVNVTSEHKENISSVKSSVDRRSRESVTSAVLRGKRDSKSGKVIAASTVTKECEIVDLDDENSDSQESKCNGVSGKVTDDDDDDEDCEIIMVPQKEPVACEKSSEMQIKIVNIGTSQEDVLEEQDKSETVMDVDDSSSQSECEIEEQNDEPVPSVVEQTEAAFDNDADKETPVAEPSESVAVSASEVLQNDDEEKSDGKEQVSEEKEKESVAEEENEKETENDKETVVEKEKEKEKVVEDDGSPEETEKIEDSASKDASEEKATEPEDSAAVEDKAEDNEVKASGDDKPEAEEKSADAEASIPAEQTNEATDAQSDAGSPQPLMIDETDGNESNDAKDEDRKGDAKSPVAADDADQSTTTTCQADPDLESKSEAKDAEMQENANNETAEDKVEKLADEAAKDSSETAEKVEKDGGDSAGNAAESGVEAMEVDGGSGETEASSAKPEDEVADGTSISNNETTTSTVPIGELVKDNKEADGTVVSAEPRKKRRRRRKIFDENGSRLKRRSARNAEEKISKDLLEEEKNAEENGVREEVDDDEDAEFDEEGSSDSSSQNSYDGKKQQKPINEDTTDNASSSVAKEATSASNDQPRPLSPPSLKRPFDAVAENDGNSNNSSISSNSSSSSAGSSGSCGNSAKRLKPSEDVVVEEVEEKKKMELLVPKSTKDEPVEMKNLVRQITQEDIRKKMKNLSSEDMEAMLLQKIVECITIRGEMGKLREQAKASKRAQEATRAKCQQLQKQVEGFEMVLKRLQYDKNLNADKYVTPIKINRSVGLQVNFQSEHGVQNLKQIQAYRANNAAAKAATSAAIAQTQDGGHRTVSPKKVMKTRPPRRPEIPIAPAVSAPMTTIPTTAALVTSKLLEASNKRPITLQNAGNIVQILQPNQQQQQTVVVNRQIQRTTQSTGSGGSNDLIDLTDEEDKSKSPAAQPITSSVNRIPARVYQAVTASGVSLAGATNLRLVTTNSPTTSTAIVNNINGQKLAYGTVVMNGNNKLLLTSNQLRQVSNVQGKNIIYNKQGISTLANGQTLRVLQPATTVQAQILRHPAALPETPSTVVSNPSWKLPPPAPSLKISKVATGIVLSWNMVLNDKFANIVSYQLYAYQEVAGTAPSPSLWKKVGDVRALPLPMACTLTQFTEGNNYHFAVRAVDEYSRFGNYSKPGHISL